MNQRPRTSLDRPTVNLTSSPVIGTNQVRTADTADSADLTEPQLPTLNHHEIAEDQIETDSIGDPNNRREVFRMIESIQSSSAANTPGKLGYDTPVHLRRFQALQRTTDIPLTPTLAPTENEEGYIGSSPTPATRDPTPAANSDAPVLNNQDVAMTDASDLPSSPPELDSRSPSPQKCSKRSRSERRRLAKARKAMHRRSLEVPSASNSPTKPGPAAESKSDPSRESTHGDHKENNDVPQGDERPPSRRLRSALSRSTDNDQNLVPAPSFGTTTKPSETAPVEQNSKSKPGSKRKKRKSSSKATNADGQQPVRQTESQIATPAPEDFVDSSSEDVETQIASQLEQDLEFAVDIGNNTYEQPVQQANSSASSKKRKREEDALTSTSKERRRSTRLSSTKDMTAVYPEHADSTYSQDSPAASQNTSQEKSTSPTLRRSTRGSQLKVDELAPSPPPPTTTQISESIQESAQDEATFQPPTKRSRKFLRHGAHSEAATQESSSRGKLSRTRSRKTRSSSQHQPSQEEAAQVDTASTGVDLFEGQNAEHDVVSESNPQEKTAEPIMTWMSTEEATDTQMTDMGPSTVEPNLANTDKGLDMDVRPVPNETPQPAPLLMQVTPTAEAQTDPIPPNPESDPSEAGITKSLRKLLDDMKLASLDPQALREVDDLLFNIRVEAHDASRRHKVA